ncbi:HutD family protein [Rhodococcus sp. (in: high G+C Gram-positive bacteria)]|uniref:HutD family protein n=1 Tax=Rhodococcus sp. TaxID=1831 RepID=UPI003B8A6386
MNDGPYSLGAPALRTTRDDRESVRWRNGQGTTQVVAETELWRVSIADEPTSSTFSVIDDYDRLFMPIGEVSIELTGADAVHHVVAPLETIEFPGEWAPACRVDRPTRALNVMVRRGHATATMHFGEPPRDVDPAALVVLVDPATEDAVLLPPGCVDAAETAGPCAVVTITTLDRP